MAAFECTVNSVTIEQHPNPEVTAIELARIGGYISIVKKGQFKTGDKVVYIPEQAVLTEELLKELNFWSESKQKGKLAGSKGNRVKAMKLMGTISQGLIYPSKEEWKIGQDVKEILGITKYEPPIPQQLGGEVGSWDFKVKFDIENIKKYPSLFNEGEKVILTEKIHGTCTIGTFIPDAVAHLRKEDMIDGKWAITSKGLASKQLYFLDCEKNKNNIYIKAFNSHIKKMLELEFGLYDEPVTFFGETFGDVQDLTYGVKGHSFRMFGIEVGDKFWDFEKMAALCDAHGIDVVPVLYKGPFSQKVLEKYTSGKEQVSGKETHLREGVVIYPEKERDCPEIGRVVLKSVSNDYLFRGAKGNKAPTEFN